MSVAMRRRGANVHMRRARHRMDVRSKMKKKAVSSAATTGVATTTTERTKRTKRTTWTNGKDEAVATWIYVPLSERRPAAAFELHPIEVTDVEDVREPPMPPAKAPASRDNGQTLQSRRSMTVTSARRSSGTAERNELAVPIFIPSYEGALHAATSNDMHRVRNWETRRKPLDNTIVVAGVAAVCAMIIAVNLLFGVLLPLCVHHVIDFASRVFSNTGIAHAMGKALASYIFAAL